MLERLVKSLSVIFPKPLVVVGESEQAIRTVLGERALYVRQDEPLGTGHALRCAQHALAGFDMLLVTPGDHPFVSADTFRMLLAHHGESETPITLASVTVPQFEGNFAGFRRFGRVFRDATGMVERIIEFKDATAAEQAIREVNTGYYCFDAAWLWKNIERLRSTNAAGEYYLTDMIALARADGLGVACLSIPDPLEGLGVNNPEELALAESLVNSRGTQ